MGISINDLSPSAQRQALEKLMAAKRSKYGNEKTVVNGVRFDSKKEAARYAQLLALQNAGKIEGLRLQEEFTLLPAYTTADGKRIRAIRYYADFSYYPAEPGGVKVVEDVKSPATRKKPDYRMKVKLMQERHGIAVTEVL